MTRAAPRPPAVTGTERAIFAAAEELLVDVSPAELTVADLLAKAGSSRTTFYRYFTSKYSVIAGMLQQLRGELAGVMAPWVERGERAPEPALRDALMAVADVWARHRSTLRAAGESWRAIEEIGAPWVAMMDRFTADVAAQIDRERAAGAAPPGPESAVVAQTLVWSSERMLHLGGLGKCGPGLERGAVEGLVVIWLGAIYLHN